MTTQASGVAKQLRYKVESTYGTAPGSSGAQSLRRVMSDLNLSKDTYSSNEMRADYQVGDFRHGVRRVSGSIKGELSSKTYSDFFAAALRKDFAAGAAITGASITISGSAPSYTLTRASGSFLTDGVKIGDVVRLTAGSFTAGNLNKNLLVTAVTALALTVMVLNGSTLTTEGPIASAALSATGKKTFVPTTGHTDKSFAFEHWFSDISQSELFTGCKINTIDISLPPTGMSEINIGVLGQDITTGSSAYYTSPIAATSTGIEAAVNGILMVGGVAVAICTGLSIKIDGGYSGDPVVGSNIIPNQFPGRVKVSGQFSAYFQDATMRDYFINESEIGLVVALTADNSAAADFVAFSLPKIKIGSAGKDDGEKGIIQTFDYTAIYNSIGGAGTSTEQTTIVVQDSQAA